MEELLEAIQEAEEDGKLTDGTSSDEELLSLSLAATARVQGKKTMRLQGNINGHEVLLLANSGSSSTFINSKLVQQLAINT